MLVWRSHDHMLGTLVAVGVRGVYSVQRVGPEWLLQGVGHDGLSMMSLPAGGKAFARLDGAQSYANELDRRVYAEVQAGGE